MNKELNKENSVVTLTLVPARRARVNKYKLDSVLFYPLVAFNLGYKLNRFSHTDIPDIEKMIND